MLVQDVHTLRLMAVNVAAVAHYGYANGRLKQRRKDGRIISVEAHSTLIRDDNGTPRLFLVVASEVEGP
ncbi:MAG: hypothetical protein ABI227_07180 [Rhodanobacter sp.]